VQFDREVVHILDNHCVMCHVENGASFPLVTYEQTYAARWKIRQDALERHMAPWAAVAGYGDFANSNALTQREIDFLVSWAESFGPRNNGEVYTGVAAAAPPKVIQAHSDFARWELGKPDLLLTVPANRVKPQGGETVERTIIDPGLTSDRWLRGLEYKPGDRRVVHAVRFTIQQSGEWLGSWTPWYSFVSFPEGLAHRLPAGSHIVAEINYYGASEPVVDQGSLGLYFAERSARRTLNLVVAGTTRIESDMNILALQPQLSPGVQSIEVAARAPGGSTQVLLFAREIPLEWPTPYVFRTPVSLRQGTQLSVIEHYAGEDSVPGTASPVTFTAYEGEALPAQQTQARPPAPSSPARHFKLTGIVKSVDAADSRLVVEHPAIAGFMGAMTMSYGVGKPGDLKGVAAGDHIQSDVVVSGSATYLENITVVRHAK
jgi:Cu/Ag efflux protein CusF